MATPSWHISGQYYENCSCDFVCPCITGQLAVKPTKGSCTVAMAFQVGQGSHGTVSLDGLGFIVLLSTPEEMGKGNWSVGVVVDARASAEQRDAITSIASGSAGGPMAALSPLVGSFWAWSRRRFASIARAPSGRHRARVGRHRGQAGDGHQSQRHGAHLSGQHGPSGGGPVCPRARREEPGHCPGAQLEGHERTEPWTVRPVLLARRVALHRPVATPSDRETGSGVYSLTPSCSTAARSSSSGHTPPTGPDVRAGR